MRAYIYQLQKIAEDVARQEHPQHPEEKLENRFVIWFNSLPPLTRQRYFSMSEFEQALHTQGKYLSPVLLKLGWQRKRVWAGQRYGRYWIPPTFMGVV